MHEIGAYTTTLPATNGVELGGGRTVALRPRPSELQPSSEGTGFLTGVLGQSNSPSPTFEDWVNNLWLGGDADFLRFACGI